jgi:mRNA interferase RelE/StbE
MTWRIEYSKQAKDVLGAMGHVAEKRILRFMHERVAHHPDPKRLAEPLYGEFFGLYRFRVGDYRVICDIEIDRLRILVVTLGHRREIYG